jgi:hypothetical protein
MNINFGLGNMRAAQLKMQSDMYNSILHNQKMLAQALKQNVARQQAAAAPAPAPAPVRPHVPAAAPAPAPVRPPAPAPAPAPAPLQNHDTGVKKLPKKGYSVLFK